MTDKKPDLSQDDIFQMSRVILVEAAFPVPLLPLSPRKEYVLERHFKDREMDLMGYSFRVPADIELDLTSDDHHKPVKLSDIFRYNTKLKEALRKFVPDEILIHVLPKGEICFHSYLNPEGKVRFNCYNPSHHWLSHFEEVYALCQNMRYEAPVKAPVKKS